MRNRSLFFLSALLLLTTPINSWSQEISVVNPTDGMNNDQFGYAVSIDQNHALVTSYLHDAGDHKGAVYYYGKVGNKWVEKAKLISSDSLDFSGFGFSIALHGNYALIGAINAPNGAGFGGATYVFEWNGSNWIQVQKLVSDIPEESISFGESVSLFEDYAIIGDSRVSHDTGKGVAYMYERLNGVWTQVARLRLTNGDSNDNFGEAVSLHGKKVAIGASGSGNGDGAVYIYEKKQGVWKQSSQIISSAIGELSDFGSAVSLDKNRLLVGDPGADAERPDTGAAYMFEFANGEWHEVARFVDSEGAIRDNFGTAVALNGKRALVGAPGDGFDRNIGPDAGSAFLYQYKKGSWQLSARLSGSQEPFKYFGTAVAISGDIVFVGEVPSGPSTGYLEDTGSAFFFDYGDKSATLQQSAAVPAFAPTLNVGSEFNLLKQNYPNPFPTSTQIEFTLADPGFTRLVVYDMLGREIEVLIEENRLQGTHSVNFDADNLPAGMYLYKLESDGGSIVKKMLILR